MKHILITLLITTLLISGCGKSDSASTADDDSLTIGVAFETLQTEYWVAGFDAIRSELDKRGFKMLEAVSDGDTHRQFEQVRNFITRGVDGIILVPKDDKTVIPTIKAANTAGIPMILFNRPAAESSAHSIAVVADNFALARDTVSYLVEKAKASGKKHKAMILIGDLGDANAIERRDGFDAAIKGHEEIIEVVARIPTEWSQEKAQAGVVNALQANPDINFIFTSSDFLLPSIVSALKAAGKYHPTGHGGHVVLGGFDGDPTAYRMLKEGYLDATGVQDVYFEAAQSVEAIVNLREGKEVSERILDPGFVIHQDNLAGMESKMWGAIVANQ